MNTLRRQDRDLAAPAGSEPERIDTSKDIQLGQWYWVAWTNRPEKELMCVIVLGSNYIGFEGIRSSGRVHLNDFAKICTRELDFRAIIQGKITHHKSAAERLLREINALTQNLGVSSVPTLGHESDTRSLSVLNQQVDVKSYKQALIKAKDIDLPKLFKQVEDENKAMSEWMEIELVPLKASLGQMKGVIETIQDRVFHVELYAGLSEDVVQVRDGTAASITEKLHLLQRRCYMDEECLADYRVGGMDIKSLKHFDKWLAEPEHLASIMPFPRCMVAFRVRRSAKDRDWRSIRTLMANIAEEEADKFTFLYIRNGGQLYRMRTSLEFGDKIFPDTMEFGTEPMMVHVSGDRVQDLITKREHDALVQAEKERVANHAAWCKVNNRKPKKPETKKQPVVRFASRVEDHYRQWEGASPYYSAAYSHRYLGAYVPFNQSTVHYDDIAEHIAKQIKQYNRIALIMQGLFDRSPVLHPHPPVSLWNDTGFQSAVVLVRDGDRAVHAGPAPDFEEYRARCNELLDDTSVTIGQEDFWTRAEAVKENARAARDWRTRDHRELEHFKPYGNDGPGFLAKVGRCGKKACTFTWQRERLRGRRYRWEPDGPIDCSIVVPKELLFNVSAYKPGDFRQFYVDPRTRAEYLKWAPFLITAEEYHAGNVKLDNEKK